MSKKLDITLYYADWCGHCNTFKPEWKKINDNIEKIQKKFKNVKITLNNYDDKQLEKIGGGKINDKAVKGFPTIKFTLEANKQKKDYDYSDYGKKRSFEYMFDFINNVCDGLHKYKK
jgi:thiol-disulfide isomerase/thioredoxin